MLSNAYFLTKFRFDTAENEPAKNLQNLSFANFANFADPNPLTPNRAGPERGRLGARTLGRLREATGERDLGAVGSTSCERPKYE